MVYNMYNTKHLVDVVCSYMYCAAGVAQKQDMLLPPCKSIQFLSRLTRSLPQMAIIFMLEGVFYNYIFTLL
jgi:hypothetical protein